MDVIEVWTPYCGAAPLPAALMQRWNFDPMLLSIFALTIVGSVLLHERNAQSIKSPYLMALAYLLTVIVFVSPFCAMASALSSIRVAHHVVLTSVIAPLVIFSFAVPRMSGSNFAILAAAAHATIFWAWHFPAVYEAALKNRYNVLGYASYIICKCGIAMADCQVGSCSNCNSDPIVHNVADGASWRFADICPCAIVCSAFVHN